MPRPTRRQLEAAASTLLTVYELPTTSARDRDSISEVRDLLWRLAGGGDYA